MNRIRTQVLALGLTIVMVFGLAGAQAYAQGQGTGNGGHPAEVAEMQGVNGSRLESWYTVKQDLIRGLELGRHRELSFDAGVTAESFYQAAIHSLKTTVLDFVDERIEIAGARRACRNRVESNGTGRIDCDLAYLIETMKRFDSETQYRFIAHEYFSVAGLEPNEYGSSSYFYSSQISKSLKTVESKRWGVRDDRSQSASVSGFQCELDFGSLHGADYSVTIRSSSAEGEINFSWSTLRSVNYAFTAPMKVVSYQDLLGYLFADVLLVVPGKFEVLFKVQMSPDSAPFLAYDVKYPDGGTRSGFHSKSCYRVSNLKPGFTSTQPSITSSEEGAERVYHRLLKALVRNPYSGR